MQQASHNRFHSHNYPHYTNVNLEPPSHHHHRCSNNSDIFVLDMTESYPDPDEQFSSMISFTEEDACSQYQLHGNKICVTKNTCAPDLPTNDDPSSDSSIFSWLNCEWLTTNPYHYPFLWRVFSFVKWIVLKIVAPCLRHRRESHNPIHL